MGIYKIKGPCLFAMMFEEEQVKEESGVPWGQTAEVLRDQIREPTNGVWGVLLETCN